MSGGDRRRSDGLRSAGRCTDWPPADSAPKNPGRSDPARPTARRRRRPVAFCAACRRRLLVAGPNAHARVKRWPCPCRLLSCRPPSASGLPSDPRRTGLRAPRGNRPSRATSRGSPEPRRPRPLGSAVLFGQPRSEPNVKTVPDALLPLLTPFFRCARSYLVRKVESPPLPPSYPFFHSRHLPFALQLTLERKAKTCVCSRKSRLNPGFSEKKICSGKDSATA
jgi:hypothetical protein